MPKQTSPAAPPTTARADATRDADVASLTYEQARDELVAVVGRLESGAATLEDSLALWERGEALAARCQQWLDGARDRLAAARGGTGDVESAPGRSSETAVEAAEAGLGTADEPDGPDGEDEP